MSSLMQNVMGVLLVLGMGVVIVAGLIASPPPSAAVAAATTNPPALPAFATALLFVLFTFGGWSEATYLSAEVKGGRRSIVKVLVLALLLVTLIYLLFVFSLLRGLGFDGLKASQAVAADVAGRSFGVFGEKLIGAIAALAALTSINATLPVSARTSYSLGKDWRIFAFMNRWSGERDAPIAALIVTGVLSLALVVVAAVNQSGVKFMVEFTAPVFWFFFLLTGLALFVLRFRQPQLARPFKVPMYPILPFVFVPTSAFLLYRSLEWALINRAVQLALYGMAAGVVAWIVARLHAHFDHRIPNRRSRLELGRARALEEER